MKRKLSLTLPDDLVATLDRMAGHEISRAAYIEQILCAFVDGRARERRETAAINRQAARLNAEMKDVLSLQTKVHDD